jgi:hypothetical protein
MILYVKTLGKKSEYNWKDNWHEIEMHFKFKYKDT